MRIGPLPIGNAEFVPEALDRRGKDLDDLVISRGVVLLPISLHVLNLLEGEAKVSAQLPVPKELIKLLRLVVRRQQPVPVDVR